MENVNLYNHAQSVNINRRAELRQDRIEVNIDNPYKDNVSRGLFSSTNQYQRINYESNKLYPTEEVNIDPERVICVNDETAIDKPSYDTKRIILFNVHNFVRQCPLNQQEITRNLKPKDLRYFLDFIRNKNSDYLMLTEVTPLVEDYYVEFVDMKNIKNEGTYGKMKRELESIGFNNNFIAETHHVPNSSTEYYSLANAIFGSNELRDKKTYNIGDNRIIMECKINIHGENFLLFVTHVRDQYDDVNYVENIDNILDVITKSSNDNQIDKIILGGDMNFPLGQVDVNDHVSQNTIRMVRPRFPDLTDEELKQNLIRDGWIQEQLKNPLEKLNNILPSVIPRNIGEISFTGFFKRKVIDHFFVSPKVLEHYDVSTFIVRSNASDHYPVFLDIKPKAAQVVAPQLAPIVPAIQPAQLDNPPNENGCPVLGDDITNIGVQFIKDNNHITNGTQLLNYFFSKAEFLKRSVSVDNLLNNIRKQHILKYNNQYYRLYNKDNNRLTLYKIISPSGLVVYSKRYQNCEILNIDITPQNYNHFEYLMIPTITINNSSIEPPINRQDFNNDVVITHYSNKYVKHIYHGTSYSQISDPLHNIDYTPYNQYGNWYSFGISPADIMMLHAVGLELKIPSESASYSTNPDYPNNPYYIYKYKIRNNIIAFDFGEEQRDYIRFILGHLLYFDVQVCNNTLYFYDNYSIRDATGKVEKYNYTQTKNLRNLQGAEVAFSSGWQIISNASAGDGDKSLAAKMCDIYNNNTDENKINVSAWIINDILHLMNCKTRDIENVGVWITYKQPFQQKLQQMYGTSDLNQILPELNQGIAPTNHLDKTSLGGLEYLYIPKSRYNDDTLRAIVFDGIITFGGKYYKKYLKYKQKYLKLKNKN